MVNGCAAHSSHRLLTRHLKTCSLVTLFTSFARAARKSYAFPRLAAPKSFSAPATFLTAEEQSHLCHCLMIDGRVPADQDGNSPGRPLHPIGTEGAHTYVASQPDPRCESTDDSTRSFQQCRQAWPF